MKKITLLLVTALFMSSAVMAQDCRYFSPITDAAPIVVSDVKFGESINRDGSTYELMMDIYMPGDTAENDSNRAVVLIAHEGGLFLGDKTDQECVELATRLTRLGYVAVSYNYRVGWAIGGDGSDPACAPPGSAEANARQIVPALWRAMQDGKDAVGFMHKTVAEMGNPYGINPNHLMHGGFGAGAFIPVHNEYVDLPSELLLPKLQTKCNGATLGTSYIDTNTMGGFLGNNHPEYPFRADGVFNLAGAIGDTLFIDDQQVDSNNAPILAPIISCHGDVDQTTPFGTAVVFAQGTLPVLEVSGSYEVARKFSETGINALYASIDVDSLPVTPIQDPNTRFADVELYTKGTYTFVGEDYQPWAYDPNSANANQISRAQRYMDTVVNYLVPRMYVTLFDTLPNCDFVASITKPELPAFEAVVAPIPTNSNLELSVDNKGKAYQFEVVNMIGEVLYKQDKVYASRNDIDMSNFATGIYFVNVHMNDQNVSLKVVKQ